MKIDKFEVAAIIKKVITMADNSLRLQVDTQELQHEQMAKVFELYNKFGNFVFKEGEITQQEFDEIVIPELKLETNEKSPSERQRAVVFRIWERYVENKKTNKTSTEFYRDFMDKHISQLKSKYLND